MTEQNGNSPTVETEQERPEIVVGAALLGGFVLAQILKRLGGDD